MIDRSQHESTFAEKNNLLKIKDQLNQIGTTFTFNKDSVRNYGRLKISRTTKLDLSDGIIFPRKITEHVSKYAVKIHPEALNYIFFLDGYKKQLLLYIIFYLMDPKTNKFYWRQQEFKNFSLFCKLQGDDREILKNTIDQYKKKLSHENIIINISRGIFMVNPMITCSTHKLRKTLTDEYVRSILKKRTSSDLHFLPKFGR